VCQVPIEELNCPNYSDSIFIRQDPAIAPHMPLPAIKADQHRAQVQYLREHFPNSGTLAVRDLTDHTPINNVSALTGLR
jgi:hypothetical protein